MTEKAGTLHNALANVRHLKEIDGEQRIIEGTATTPTTDRAGDIVMPLGAKFKLPIPLLLDHDHKQAVGEVEWAKATKAGIRFRARIATIDKPGAAKDLVDYAWQLVQSGLRKTVSIGFRSLLDGFEIMPDGGIKFSSWEWLELSLVAVPAQADATVDEFKSGTAARRIADGTKRVSLKETRVVSLLTPAERQLKEGEEKLDRLGSRKPKTPLSTESGTGSRGSVVYSSTPGQRELSRIDARLKDIAKSLKQVDRDEYNHFDDNDRLKALDKVKAALIDERSFLVERRTGIAHGVVAVTEKEVRAPLLKATPLAAAVVAPSPKSALRAKRPWPAVKDSADDDAWGQSTTAGMRGVQKLLDDAGYSPDTPIRADTLRTFVGMAMGTATAAYKAVEVLQQRILDPEATGIKFAGVWQRAQGYERGAIVTSAGSAWVALKEVPEGIVPGQAPEFWQLMVKAGKDGKDGPVQSVGGGRAVKL